MTCKDCRYWIKSDTVRFGLIGSCIRNPQPVHGKDGDDWCGEFECTCLIHTKGEEINAIRCGVCDSVWIENFGVWEEYVQK